MSETRMPMTDGEICEMYRTAASKAKQVGILAQLNSTSRERIVEILEANGYQVDGRATRYLKKEERIATAPEAHRNDRTEALTPKASPHTHTHSAAPEPITVGRLLLALAEIPKESLVLIGETEMTGIAFSRGWNMQTGEQQLLLTLV